MKECISNRGTQMGVPQPYCVISVKRMPMSPESSNTNNVTAQCRSTGKCRCVLWADGSLAVFCLRPDYGPSWNGDLIIKNCTMGPTITSVISGSWRSFYNGLPNYMFRSVTIEGLTVESTSSTIYVYQISSASKSALNDSVNKLFLPDSIKVSGVTGTSGRSVTVKASKSNTDAFSTVTVTKE